MQQTDCMKMSLQKIIHLISVGLQSEPVGCEQLKNGSDPLWAWDVGPLQSAGGSSAAYSNSAEHHSVHHRSDATSSVYNANQRSVC